MKKPLNYVLLTAVMILTPAIVSAAFKGGESGGGSAGVTSVADFKSQCDLSTDGGGGLLGGLLDSAVEGAKCDEMEFTLQGNIVGHIDNDYYEFKDETGTVTVEIRDWNGVDAGPSDLVRLTGDGDYEEIGVILEVERLQLVK